MFVPLQLRICRKTLKEVQVIIFTCMTTRAVHLELVTDRSTDTFPMAFRRFASLRGHPSNCWSDRGTNFVGAQSYLSSSPCTKEATTRQGMQKGANFCTTLPLLYYTSDWLNQQNLPKLQVDTYLFILNWSTIFISTKSLLNLNATVILCGEHWKIGGFYCLCLRLLWLVGMFTQWKLPFRIELKYILFHKPPFHQLINSWSENKTVSMWGKLIAAEQ